MMPLQMTIHCDYAFRDDKSICCLYFQGDPEHNVHDGGDNEMG